MPVGISSESSSCLCLPSSSGSPGRHPPVLVFGNFPTSEHVLLSLHSLRMWCYGMPGPEFTRFSLELGHRGAASSWPLWFLMGNQPLSCFPPIVKDQLLSDCFQMMSKKLEYGIPWYEIAQVCSTWSCLPSVNLAFAKMWKFWDNFLLTGLVRERRVFCHCRPSVEIQVVYLDPADIKTGSALPLGGTEFVPRKIDTETSQFTSEGRPRWHCQCGLFPQSSKALMLQLGRIQRLRATIQGPTYIWFQLTLW